MNITELIRELKEQRRREERTIAALEAIWEVQENAEHSPIARSPNARRGRKAMTEPEREEVLKRMKEYWAVWRRQRAKERKRGGGSAAAARAGPAVDPGLPLK